MNSRSQDKQLELIEKLFDEKNHVVMVKMDNMYELLKRAVNRIDENRKDIQENKRWISEFSGKIAVISAFAGLVIATFFEIGRDILMKMLKVK